MEPITMAIIYGISRGIPALIKAIEEKKNKSAAPLTVSCDPNAFPPALTFSEPENNIILLGRASVGKSSLGNALLGCSIFKTGPEYGTTTTFQGHPYKNGYQVKDSPGLLDSAGDRNAIFQMAMTAKIVVYVTAGQLYQAEQDFVSEIIRLHDLWNKRGNGKRHILFFMNMSDHKARSMPKHVRENEFKLLHSQAADWTLNENVHRGSASPTHGENIDIASLENRLNLLF